MPGVSAPDVTWSQFVALLGTVATIFFVILAQLFAALVVGIVLVFLTGPLSHLPSAVLASVVFLIAARLIDAHGIRDIWRRRRIEFNVAIVTAATVVLVGVQQGIGLAMALSVIVHLRHSYRPADLLLAPDASGRLRPHPVESGAQAAPGVIVYGFAANHYHANASHLAQQVLPLAEADPPPRRIVIEAGSIGDIDYSGSAELAEVQKELGARGVTLELCDLQDRARIELRRDGLLDAIGPEHVSVDDAVAGHGGCRPVRRSRCATRPFVQTAQCGPGVRRKVVP